MNGIKYYTEEFPGLDQSGARYVVIAHFGSWREGAATSNASAIPQIKRELLKRFMNRLTASAA